MLASHLGLLWEKLRAEYPVCQEVPPLARVIEQFGGEQQIQIEVTEVPPLPRTWFLRRDETGLVQIQRDRFLHNWKKMLPEDEYPRYETVIRQFKARLADFEAFVAEHKLGAVKPAQYELTYVNHIPRGEKVSSLVEIGRVFPDFVWRSHEGRFLREPNDINWRTTTNLPEESGRLHATVRSVTRQSDNTDILLFELTARGFPKDKSREAMWAWFDLAHEWIVRSFADLTGEEFQRDVWRRTR